VRPLLLADRELLFVARRGLGMGLGAAVLEGLAVVGDLRREVGNTRTLDAHACRLRKKLVPSSRPWVVNVRGVGYKLTEAL
jgi:Transcriptional regulatory protein, C terminal